MNSLATLKEYTFIDKDQESTSFTHSITLAYLSFLIGKFVKEHRLGVLLLVLDTIFPISRQKLRPDLIFLLNEHRPSKADRNKSYSGVPDIVFEIVSPKSIIEDATMKKDLYALEGVPEYWAIVPEFATVYVYILQEIEGERSYKLHCVAVEKGIVTSTVLKDFQLEISKLFEF